MKKNSILYQTYTKILLAELRPAMGCTEPISIAYAAAKCRDLLGCKPERCILEVSSSIIKNAKSVTVPNTSGLKGIAAAVAAGIVGGNAEAELQVIAEMGQAQIEQIEPYLSNTPVEIRRAQNGIVFYIDMQVWGQGHTARLIIADHHTNIVHVEKDGDILFDKAEDATQKGVDADKTSLTIAGIWDYVQSVDLSDISPALTRQIEYNSALSKEGLTHSWGAEIGRILQKESNGNVRMLAQAAAAAGSDARMNGCELPAVILSGSGNQGITATMPVLVYAQHLASTQEQLFRALVLADLVTIHQKEGIGSVSAFCGAVCAGIGAGCGIAYLQGADYKAICHTIVNALAILSGMICDGAKSSCAAKISSAVDAGIMGYTMYVHGKQFYDGEGIVKKGVENSINNVCTIARDGMRETNDCILDVMLKT